ncbi:hypothetical protein AB1N83_011245 [Pleurotus pulmonarius]
MSSDDALRWSHRISRSTSTRTLTSTYRRCNQNDRERRVVLVEVYLKLVTSSRRLDTRPSLKITSTRVIVV